MFGKKNFNGLLYNEIFDHRARKYHQAMVSYPNARDEEFYEVACHISGSSPLHIADVPSGAGYLKKYLPLNCNYLAHESCDGFLSIGQQHHSHTKRALFPLPWADESIDVMASVAGLHHTDDKVPIFEEFRRVIKHQGMFIILDVLENSNVARFLDDYVGQNNSTGHQGIYLNKKVLHDMELLDWHIDHAESTSFNWVFNDRLNMAIFCHLLFDIRHVDYQKTIDAIDYFLGVDELSEEKIGMNWSLYKIIARKS